MLLKTIFAASTLWASFVAISVAGESTVPKLATGAAEAARGPSASNLKDDVFSFRGIPLGITLAEFRAIPFPDLKRWPGVQPICSGDEEASHLTVPLSVGGLLGKAGVTICKYYKPGEPIAGIGLLSKWDEWAPDFAGIGNYDTVFFFCSTGDGQQRLYSILIQPSAEHFETIRAAIIARYGDPAKVQSETVQNGLGAKFERVNLFWESAASTLTLQNPGDTLNSMVVSYSHLHLSDEVEKAKKSAAKAAAGKL
jgi:hypothetical protein